MIFGNRANEIGDIVLIVARAPIVGVIQLTGFTTDVQGETIERYFHKEFSYSIDGLFFTPFIELTNANLQSIQIINTDTFYINYKYTRRGLYDDGLLIFNSVTLLGQFDQPLCINYYVLPKSIFRDIFCYNPEHLGLCIALTQKCFEEGIVPKFLVRNQTSDPKKDDKDYIDFWDAVCCFYALLIVFARKFQNYGRIQEMLILYLTQFNHFISLNDVEFADLVNIKKYRHGEIKKRGTYQIFKVGTNNEINGEFLRLINYKSSDELIVAQIASHWLVDINCPTYGGFSQHTQINKIKQPLSIVSVGGIVNQTTIDGVVITEIEAVTDGSACGFGKTNNQQHIVINDQLDYQLKFDVASDIVNDEILSCRAVVCDQYDNILQCKDITTDLVSNAFFEGVGLPIENKFYTICCILYNSNQEILVNSKPNIGLQRNLKLPIGANKLYLEILLDRSDNGGSINSKLSIKNIALEPIVSGYRVNKKQIIVSTPTSPSLPTYLNYIWHNNQNNQFALYDQTLSSWINIGNLQKTLVDLQKQTHYESHSFLDREQLLLIFCKNNGDISFDKVQLILKNYLLDYSSHSLLIDL